MVNPPQVPRHSAMDMYLAQAGLKLDELDGIIKEKFTKESWNGHNRSRHIRIQWLRFQSKVEAIQINLRSINSSLTTCLTTMIVLAQVRLQTSVRELALVTNKISGDQIRLNSTIRKRLNLQNDHLSQLSKQHLQIQGTMENEQVPQARSEEAPRSSMGKEQASNGSVRNHSTYGFESVITVRTPYESLGQCNRLCICCCHPKRCVRMNDLLSTLTGSMCLNYVGGPTSRPCDQSSCRRKLPPIFNITYYFPRWLLTKMVSLCLSFDPTGSPSLCMHMPLIRPDTSKIFHLATAGDIGGMKTMFEKGLASPNDVAYTFGYSVLHVSVIPWQCPDR